MKNIDVALIYDLWREYAVAANDGDLERWLSLWSQEALQMPPGAPRRVGKEQIRKGMQPLFAHCHTHKVIIQPEKIRIIGHRAYSYGTFAYKMTPVAGLEPRYYRGKFLDIVEKQADGSWKIIIDCHNYDMPCHECDLTK